MKARLLFTNDCTRNCKGCCNKNWTGDKPKEISFLELLEFEEIYILLAVNLCYMLKD